MAAVCISLNSGGSWNGSYTVCGVEVIFGLAPTDGTAAGYVLSYTDTSTGETRAVQAVASSTCNTFVCFNVILSCGTYNITVRNDPSCCGSTSGAAPVTITTPCCPNGMDERLYARVAYAAGNCNGTELIGRVIPLTYDPTLPAYTWKGRYVYSSLPQYNYYTDFFLQCDPANNTWFLTLVAGGTNSVYACASAKREASGGTCGPPMSLIFRMSPMSGDACCSGALYVYIGVSP